MNARAATGVSEATGAPAGSDAQPAQRSGAVLGRQGEDLAAEYLAATGLVVLSRNWRCREGELDLVATDCERLIVCEVKTRSGTGYGEPSEAVTPAKAARIRRVTAEWLRAHRVGWCEIRFDVLAVLYPQDGPVTVEHLRGAF
ncbi:MAG TPA: YraN family protein [Pseudonocardiaceae bacterium]|nr:YraN family protein [Pseudonocardiaceae bacterium]